MIRFIETTELDQVHALRKAVFCEEQGVSVEEEIDDLDDQAIHLLGLAGETGVATARLFVLGPKGKIGRVCTAASHRGTGIGADLMRHAMGLLRARGCTSAVLSAQVQVIPFYEKLGFVAHGEVYDDAGIPHRDMTAPLQV